MVRRAGLPGNPESALRYTAQWITSFSWFLSTVQSVQVQTIFSSFLKIVSGNPFAVNEGSSRVQNKMMVENIPNSLQVAEADRPGFKSLRIAIF
jgi:hypothetical protein